MLKRILITWLKSQLTVENAHVLAEMMLAKLDAKAAQTETRVDDLSVDLLSSILLDTAAMSLFIEILYELLDEEEEA